MKKMFLVLTLCVGFVFTATQPFGDFPKEPIESIPTHPAQLSNHITK